jgi:hypothetical protein
VQRPWCRNELGDLKDEQTWRKWIKASPGRGMQDMREFGLLVWQETIACLAFKLSFNTHSFILTYSVCWPVINNPFLR